MRRLGGRGLTGVAIGYAAFVFALPVLVVWLHAEWL